MKRNKIRKIIFLAIFTALNVAISRIILIPVPFTHGYINLCDAGIMLIAALVGPEAGLLVGGCSGFLLDLISGYGQFMLFSLVVHGLEGYLVGKLYNKQHYWCLLLANLSGAVIMVLGYFIADIVLYGITAGVLGIFTNVVQGIAGSIIAVVLVRVLKDVKFRRRPES
ncbi:MULTISPECIES: ECF transporter S component [unclassified Ligilactobacillus]|uniref:ECF transporter S component n=1 Tax=unclassified Ligilactobacillus TaxID=2767920 RepID=UPI003854948F